MQQKRIPIKKTAPLKTAQTPGGNWPLFLMAGSIALFTLLVFSTAMDNSFINQDDGIYVYSNSYLGKPLSEAILYFFGPHYFSGNYIPLTMTGYALAYHINGVPPEFYHKINIFFHIANVLLVFWFIYLLSGKKPVVAAIVSLLFGIHPMHVESVAWVAELKDVLYTFFFMAGLITYYKYMEWCAEKKDIKNGTRLFLVTFLFFILSVLSKPAAIIFPLVLLLLDFYDRRKFDKWVWLEKLPFLIVSFIFGIIAVIAQHADNLINNNYSFPQRLIFASYGLLNYLVKLLLPIHLSAFYPFPPVVGGHLPYLYYAAPAIILLLGYCIYRTLKHTRIIAFGFMFFFINIILVLQILSVGNAIVADRYTYVPYIGLFFITAMGSDWLWQNKNPALKNYKSIAITAIAAFALACSYLSYERCKVWQNQNTMATDILDKFPNDGIALNNKGYILFMDGNLTEAVALLTKALKLKPEDTKVYINLINSYLGLKDYDNALNIADQALVRFPNDYNIFVAKGNIFSKQQKYGEAKECYIEATQAKKGNTEAYLRLADCYYAMKDYDNWLATLETVLKIDPENYLALNNKGYALFLKGKYAEATGYFKASLNINPDFKLASENLSNCDRAMGRAK